MSINLETEEPLTIEAAAVVVAGMLGKSKPMAITTIWRWTQIGLHGVRLRHGRLGKSIVTSRKALSEFAAELGDARTAGVPAIPDGEAVTPDAL